MIHDKDTGTFFMCADLALAMARLGIKDEDRVNSYYLAEYWVHKFKELE